MFKLFRRRGFVIPEIRQRFLKIEKWRYFKYDYRKAWVKVFDEFVGFLLYGFVFSVLFSYVEGIELFNSIYYFFTTVSTVGYGDISPQTILGKLMFIFCLVLYGIFKLASLGNLFLDAKSLKKELKDMGRLFMPMENHIVLFLNAADIDHNDYIWLSRFIKENLSCHKFSGSKILLVNNNIEVADDLVLYLKKENYFDEKVELINGDIYESSLLDKISVASAKQIYILSQNSEDYVSDSIVLDTVERIREADYKGDIACELIDDDMRKRLYKHDVSVVIRPNRSYPEMIIRCAISPGSQHMLEELLAVGGDTLEMFSVSKEVVWADLIYHLSKNDIGTATAYFDENGNIDTNPNGSLNLNVSGILMMVNDIRGKSYDKVHQEIKDIIDAI
jgi:voltage-gated potassium channel